MLLLPWAGATHDQHLRGMHLNQSVSRQTAHQTFID
jgi:hypothetical protein